MKSILDNYFYPESIAVIGASSKPKSIGYEILRSISEYKFTGNVYPVNPKSESILGYKSYPSVASIDKKIDLALVVVPKRFVEDSLDELIKKDVKAILLVTAGFKEAGEEGEELEKLIVDKISAGGAKLVGPNCMGVINTSSDIKLNATFVAETPAQGRLAFLSQSGAIGAAVLNSLRESDIKFAHFISVGNKADLNENDFIKYWEADDNIKIIAAYLESFENGFEFLKPYILGEHNKPCIVLKAGRKESGQKAASSHTGAVSSEDGVIDALLGQFGIIRAQNLNELFNTAKGFEDFPMPAGSRIAVITNAGGPAILAVDEIEKRNLRLAEFKESTRSKLKDIVNPEGSINNPVDMLPGATADLYKQVNEIAIADENVDAVISVFVEPVMVDAFEVIESVNRVESNKPLMQAVMPLPELWEKYRSNSESGRTLFRNPEEPAKVLSDMLFYSRKRLEIKNSLKEYSGLISLGQKQLDAKPGFLPQQEISKIMDEYGLPILNNRLIKPEEVNDLDDLEFPVVLKGLNESVVHKSEMNAVAVNIRNKDGLLSAAQNIESNFKEANLDVENFMLQTYVEARHELLVGGYRDSSFGPVLVFGTGGKYVEVYNDSATVSAYASDIDIEAVIRSTKMGDILTGVRGDKPVDIEAIKDLLKRCSRMMIEIETILEFDFNPVIVDEDNRLHLVDVRINLR